MFKTLIELNKKTENFELITTRELWADPHRANQMLDFHLNSNLDISSRKHSFVKKSAQWIYDYFDLGPQSEIVDFGCGPGLYTEQIATKGARVTGVDFSSNSINYARAQARKSALPIEYLLGDYLEVPLKNNFDLVIMIFCDFCALSPGQRFRLLEKIYSVLKPGGKVLIDVFTEKAFHKKTEDTSYNWNPKGGFWSNRSYHEFKASFKYPALLTYLDKYLIVEENKFFWIYNWLHHFDESSLGKTFEQAGFRVNSFFADVAGAPLEHSEDELAIVVEKK